MAIQEFSVKSNTRNQVRILHVSDFHFKPETNTVNDLAHFEEAVRTAKRDIWINKSEEQKFDLVIMTGDMADHGIGDSHHREVLMAARDYLLQIANNFCVNGSAGLVVVPGNHDYRWAGNIPDKKAQETFDEVFRNYSSHRIFKFDNAFPVFVACFDSNQCPNGETKLEFARGCIDIARLNGDGEDFQSVGARFPRARRIALVHHHPLPIPGAERTALKTRLEKILKVPLEGAPEYMLLRNAGVFLQKLLDHGFELLLHGHLHEPGFSRVHLTTADGLEKWIEVVACGSILDGAELSFNTINISTESIEVRTHPWTAEGQARQVRRMPTATYDVRRLSHLTDGAASVASRFSSETWLVHLDHGDLETIEYDKGYHCIGEEPQHGLKISTMAQALTQTEWKAKRLPDGEIISSTPKSVQGHAGPVEYAIQFDPPLTRGGAEADVVCWYLHRGAMYRSKEDKEFCGETEDLEHDHVTQTLIRPKDKMVIQVRFLTEKPERVPKELIFEVFDPDGNRCEGEMRSGHVTFGYRKPSEAAVFGELTGIPAEATLVVHRPRVGYKYALRWSLPSDPQLNPVPVSRRRKKLTSLADDVATIRKCQAFLNEVLNALKQYSSSTDDMVAHIFGFKEVKNQKDNNEKGLPDTSRLREPLVFRKLVPIANSGAPPNDPLARKEFVYGHDVIGASFRWREPVAFIRRDTEFRFFRRVESDGLEYLVALPLLLSNGAAAGVVALASMNEHSPMFELCTKGSLNKVTDEVNRVFRVSFPEISQDL